MLTQDLLALIDEKHLLKHPFYQAWSMGTLPIEVMKKYAELEEKYTELYYSPLPGPGFLEAEKEFKLKIQSCSKGFQ